MAGTYDIVVRNPAGARVAVITDYEWLDYTSIVSGVGSCSFALAADDDALAYLVDKALIEVYRKDTAAGITKYCDFYGIVRRDATAYKDREITVITAPDQAHQLSWRVVAYPSGVELKSQFTTMYAQMVAYYLVAGNFGTNATLANGRIRAGIPADRTINPPAFAAGGAQITIALAQITVLEALQKIARLGGGDFSLRYDGAATWSVLWHTGQRGTDRRTSVVFAMELGNMTDPSVVVDRTNESSVVIVGGKGEGTLRQFATVAGTNYSTSNDIEEFRAYTNADTVATLQSHGSEWLKAKPSLADLRFNVLQQGRYRYGRDYFVGDLVTARYRGVSGGFKVVSARVSVKDTGEETINIGLEAI